MDAPFSFNRSTLRIGSRRDRITDDSGALTGRELAGAQQGGQRFLAKRLPDKRARRRIRHSQKRLCADASAAGAIRAAGIPREATELAGRSGAGAGHQRPGGHGSSRRQGRAPALAQPTLSRRVAARSEIGRVRCCVGVAALAGCSAEPRWAAVGVRRRRSSDIDSLPVEVHGEQPGSAWNGLSPAPCIIRSWRRGGPGRHPGPAAARGAGAYGGRRAGVRAWRCWSRSAASCGKAAVASTRAPGAADGGSWRSGSAPCGPASATMPMLKRPPACPAWTASRSGNR